MDQRDEFSKWMGTIVDALAGKDMDSTMSNDQQGCNCQQWDCNTCFPETGAQIEPEVGGIEMTMQPDENHSLSGDCPNCGYSHDGHHETEEFEVPMDEDDGLMTNELVDEEDSDFNEQPKPSYEKGKNGGVKLGSIVQNTRLEPTDGHNSPLSLGDDNLDEEQDDYVAGHDYENDSPIAQRGYRDEGTILDPDEAMEMIDSILSMQGMGLSKSSSSYTEHDLANLNPVQLKKCYDEVMGTVSEDDMSMDTNSDNMGMSMGSGSTGEQPHYAPGTAPTMPESTNYNREMTMENVDKDVAAMLKTLKAYDKLNEAFVPISMPRKQIKEEEKEDGNPWEKLGKEFTSKNPDKEEHDTETGGHVKRTDKGLQHKAADKKKVDEGVDPEVLEWMQRFAKLGKMNNFNRE